MTCIVGIVDEDKVYIGGDSAGVAGLNLWVRADLKVFNIGEFVFGFTSSFRMGQLLQYSFTPPKIGNGDLMKYMATDFVDAVRETLKAGGYAQIDKNVEKAGAFLVGVRGRLFSIEDDYQVGETICGYNAVGCGASFALGSLATTEGQDLPPKQKVRIALEAAEKFSAGVSKPFTIKTTRKAK